MDKVIAFIDGMLGAFEQPLKADYPLYKLLLIFAVFVLVAWLVWDHSAILTKATKQAAEAVGA